MGFFDYTPIGMAYNWVKDKGGFGTDPSIISETFYDPVKRAVASPLSEFLKSRIGKGMPRFEDATGHRFAALDPKVRNRFSEFVGLNSTEFFNKFVRTPATEAFTRDALPIAREGFAGSLRGSGRFRTEEDLLNRFQQDLSVQEGQLALELPQAQVEAGKTVFEIDQQRTDRIYEDWWRSLPENNPVLTRALEFLNADSGQTILGGLDAGRDGWFFDLLKAAAGAAGTAAGAAAAGCWVANAVYGSWEDFRTIYARFYVHKVAPMWFKTLYMRFGEGVAAWIKKARWRKKLFYPLVNFMTQRGREVLYGRCR